MVHEKLLTVRDESGVTIRCSCGKEITKSSAAEAEREMARHIIVPSRW